jgi:hypothetical protein
MAERPFMVAARSGSSARVSGATASAAASARTNDRLRGVAERVLRATVFVSRAMAFPEGESN